MKARIAALVVMALVGPLALLAAEAQTRRGSEECGMHLSLTAAGEARGMAGQPKVAWIEGSYHEYVTKWLWNKWGYAHCWEHHFSEMLLWYSAAGAALLNEKAADGFVRNVRLHDLAELPAPRRATWEAALVLTREICAQQACNPVEWFTGRCANLAAAWERLDAIPYIGPKIASFIMRDLSLMRDYSNGAGEVRVIYKSERDPRWFDRLPHEDQALFIPIDTYVRDAAVAHGASAIATKHDVQSIQTDAARHRAVATEIVRWGRAHGYEPRDLDVYWYSIGAQNIHEDGTPVTCLKWSSE